MMSSGDSPARVAVVSGAASGIGAAVAAELSDRGWQVAGLDLTRSGWDLGLVVDMAEPDDVARAVRQVEDDLGPVSAVVSAAGHYAMVPVEEIGLAAWSRMLRVHLGGLLNLSRAVLPSWRSRPSSPSGAATGTRTTQLPRAR
jgi:NADP-dependent 3-hydroxy acid dehydrogenase YdfG